MQKQKSIDSHADINYGRLTAFKQNLNVKKQQNWLSEMSSTYKNLYQIRFIHGIWEILIDCHIPNVGAANMYFLLLESLKQNFV